MAFFTNIHREKYQGKRLLSFVLLLWRAHMHVARRSRLISYAILYNQTSHKVNRSYFFQLVKATAYGGHL